MAKSKDKTEELSLESTLWNCRVSLRGFGSTERNSLKKEEHKLKKSIQIY